MVKLIESPWDDLTHPLILVVEDSDEDFYTLLRATRQVNTIEQLLLPYRLLRLQDGDEALDYLFREGHYQSLDAPLPTFVLLDLNLPGTDGREIIQRIKQDPTLKKMPVVVLTTSNSPHDVQTCYGYGANSYLLKPMGMTEMRQTVEDLFSYWFNRSLLPFYG